MVDDCLKRGKSVQEGGAVYNFTGPQGFGIANMADSLFAVRKLVYEEKKVTMEEMKEALAWNFGKGLDQQSVSDTAEAVLRKMKDAGQKIDENTVSSILKAVMNAQPGEEKMKRYEEIHNMMKKCRSLEMTFRKWTTLRGMWPILIQNLFRIIKTQEGDSSRRDFILFCQCTSGWTDQCKPDGRYAHTPVADGVSPSAGKDVNGPTAAATSVSRLGIHIYRTELYLTRSFIRLLCPAERDLKSLWRLSVLILTRRECICSLM